MNDLKLYIWNNKESRIFLNSCKNLNLEYSQLYNPIYSLYLHIHNTKNSLKLIEIQK